MALWDKLMAELVDIVEWLDDTNDTLAYRFERYQNEIKYGAKLVVREGQMAAFINEGKLADVFKPGTYTLTTQNMPILATLRGWKYGFNSPFKAEVYFVSTRKFTDLKWGTPGPAMMRDKDFGMVRATAFGIYSIRVKDPGIFVKDLVGTDDRFTTARDPGEPARQDRHAHQGADARARHPGDRDGGQGDRDGQRACASGSRPTSRPWAWSWSRCRCRTSACPRKSRRRSTSAAPSPPSATCRRTRSTRRPRRSAMRPTIRAAPPGAGVGLGAGVAMGAQMMNNMGGAMGRAARWRAGRVRRRSRARAVFHVAVGQSQTGPFDLGALQQQVAAGQLTRDTLVWKTGMAQWVKAGEVPELAALFANTPPPIPR